MVHQRQWYNVMVHEMVHETMVTLHTLEAGIRVDMAGPDAGRYLKPDTVAELTTVYDAGVNLPRLSLLCHTCASIILVAQ
jgi:hypothetical protein